MQFPIHDLKTAPEQSRPVLEAIIKNYGFLPNLAGGFATSPAVLGALLGLISAFDNDSMTLSPLERQVVLLSASAQNECEYCMAAHGMLAHNAGLDTEDVRAAQQRQHISDDRLEALRRFAGCVVEMRGWVPDVEIDSFMSAGFTQAQVLEVVLGVALKTLTNYVNHIVKPAVNPQFAKFAPVASRGAA